MLTKETRRELNTQADKIALDIIELNKLRKEALLSIGSEEDFKPKYVQDLDNAIAGNVKHYQEIKSILVDKDADKISADALLKCGTSLIVTAAVLLFETRGPITGKLGSSLAKLVF